jgi:hypothetical protein
MIIIPLNGRAWGIIPLLIFLFVCGLFFGAPIVVLFTDPKLSEMGDLWGLLGALVASVFLYLFWRNKAWAVFGMALSSVVGGMLVSPILMKDDLVFRQARVYARSRAPLPVHASHPAAPAPTAPAAASIPAKPLRVQTIFSLGTNSSAVINGQTVSVGAQVEGWHVKAIGAKNVVLEDSNGKTNVLFLK